MSAFFFFLIRPIFRDHSIWYKAEKWESLVPLEMAYNMLFKSNIIFFTGHIFNYKIQWGKNNF